MHHYNDMQYKVIAFSLLSLFVQPQNDVHFCHADPVFLAIPLKGFDILEIVSAPETQLMENGILIIFKHILYESRVKNGAQLFPLFSFISLIHY